MNEVVIFTDGACSGNPGPGGCAAILVQEGRRTELSRGFRWTTNNRMELSGAILALRTLDRRSHVDIHTDSRYVMDAFDKDWIRRWKTNGWRTTSKTPVQNIDLWTELDALLARHESCFHWVKGHSNHPENTRCDVLAVAASTGLPLLVDAEYEKDNPLPVAGQAPVHRVKLGQTYDLF